MALVFSELTKNIQIQLNDHFDAKLKVDGLCGPLTSKAIRAAESHLGLFEDGIEDVNLLEALSHLQGIVKDLTPTPEDEDGIASIRFETLKSEYEKLYANLKIKKEFLPYAKSVCASIMANKKRFEAVQKITYMPWDVIAIINVMECGGRFNRHLHCGDPLTARTVHVPKGRPKTGKPPFTWEESAIDALGGKDAFKSRKLNWSIADKLFFLEAYNGWGYRRGAGQNTTPKRRSPYLWSGTTAYKSGKYTSDGKFDVKAVSKQLGCAAILWMLDSYTFS